MIITGCYNECMKVMGTVEGHVMEKLNEELKVHFKELVRKERILGAVYCVSHRQNIDVYGKVGIADSLVDIQSVTKMFTAAAVLLLQEQGKISLDTTVAQFLPEFSGDLFSRITVLNLLTHTSGLAALNDAFPERDLDWEAGVNIDNVEDTWIQAILDKGLFFEPGTRWEYSKAGFCILGGLIRRITGQRAEQYILDNILLPCGMEQSHWKHDTGIWDVIPQTASGLFVPIRELVQFGSMIAAGGMYRGRRVLEEESVCLMERNLIPVGMRDFCWNHAGKYVAYGAGCPVYVEEYEPEWRMGAGTIYHEGSGACMLMVNRKEELAAAWSTPFCDRNSWCDEAVKGTAAKLWQNSPRR